MYAVETFKSLTATGNGCIHIRSLEKTAFIWIHNVGRYNPLEIRP